MIKNLNKIFGKINMSWLKVVIFAIITALLTAIIMILPIFDSLAIKDIGVGFSCWFIFAIFIISNCESAWDAGKKTFLFFLISQPLIYLFQQPFVEINLIKTYYFRWFIITLFTFPGAMIAYQAKKQKIYSPFILAIAGIFLAIDGTVGIINEIVDKSYIDIFYSLVLVLFALLIGIPLLKKRKYIILYIAIIFLTIISSIIFSFTTGIKNEKYLYDINKDGNWMIAGMSNINNTSISMKDENTIEFDHKKYAHADITCINEKEEVIYLVFDVKKGEVTIEEKNK